MPFLGFSTGALSKGELAKGFAAVLALDLRAIELSALRVRELDALVAFIFENDFSSFSHVSIHAPTDYSADDEARIARLLLPLATARRWGIVVHPDVIARPELWQPFQEWLRIENMDKRKAVGRTAAELRQWFELFPHAGLCFDIAHARQVDTSMTAAYRILRQFGPRIRQIHVSEVTSSSKHDRMSESAILAFQEVADLIPRDVAVILETPVTVGEARRELSLAARMFDLVRTQ